MTKKEKLLSFLHRIADAKFDKDNLYNWKKIARPNQLPPDGDWMIWLILAGRGFGKTRMGAETVKMWVESNAYKRIALISTSVQEARSIMVEGESGLLNLFPSYKKVKYFSSKNYLQFHNGAKAFLYGGDFYEKLRGPQFDAVWIDEFAKFKHYQETWDQILFSLRLGQDPKIIITTTPKPIPLLRNLMHSPQVVITKGSTFENTANLSKRYIEQMKEQYEGTRLGLQELHAELLTSEEGALWTSELIQYKPFNPSTPFQRIIIAIDPATTNHAHSDETGIIVAGIDEFRNGYVLEDLSGKFSPHDWGKRVIQAYWHYKADRVVAEVNKGGDLVEKILKSLDPSVSYRPVRATRGKITRAEPIAALYEQKKIFHTKAFPLLEQQLCHYTSSTKKSPDRLDALVWAFTDLFLQSERKAELKIWREG